MIKVKASDIKTGNLLDDELRWWSGREGQRMFENSFINRDEAKEYCISMVEKLQDVAFWIYEENLEPERIVNQKSMDIRRPPDQALSPMLPAIRWAFGYAVVWGGLTVLLPLLMSAEYSSLGIAVATSVLGAMVVALGFAVRRRSQAAAWGLVAYALLDILSRLLLHHKGFIMPLILLVLALRAAIYLRRQSQ